MAPDANRVVLTAGFQSSPVAVALSQLLIADGVRVTGILVVTPFQFARARRLIRSQGLSGFRRGLERALGGSRQRPIDRDPADPLEAVFTAHGLARHSLPVLAKRYRIRYREVFDLNAPQALAFLGAARPTGVIYCGGGILRRPFLAQAAYKVLNAHAGPLPQVRGMNALEWSLLLGEPLETTIHFIDEDIDTGPVVDRVPIAIEAGDTIERLRSKALAAAVVGLRRSAAALSRPLPPRARDAASHKQVFVLAPALKELLEHRLRVSAGAMPQAESAAGSRS